MLCWRKTLLSSATVIAGVCFIAYWRGVTMNKILGAAALLLIAAFLVSCQSWPNPPKQHWEMWSRIPSASGPPVPKLLLHSNRY